MCAPLRDHEPLFVFDHLLQPSVEGSSLLRSRYLYPKVYRYKIQKKIRFCYSTICVGRLKMAMKTSVGKALLVTSQAPSRGSSPSKVILINLLHPHFSSSSSER
jgi:hypothetical protein